MSRIVIAATQLDPKERIIRLTSAVRSPPPKPWRAKTVSHRTTVQATVTMTLSSTGPRSRPALCARANAMAATAVSG
jgi:hypothetical protein